MDLDLRLVFHMCITGCLLAVSFTCSFFTLSLPDPFVAFYSQPWVLHSEPASPVQLCGLDNPSPCANPSDSSSGQQLCQFGLTQFLLL